MSKPTITVTTITEVSLKITEIQAAGLIMLLGNDSIFDRAMASVASIVGSATREVVEEELQELWSALGDPGSGARGILALQKDNILPEED